MSDRIEKAEAAVAEVFDHAPDEGVDSVEFARMIVRALNGRGFLAPELQQEWMATVGWRDNEGLTEENEGCGNTRDEALADARNQPRLLGVGDDCEVAHKAMRRFVSTWEEA